MVAVSGDPAADVPDQALRVALEFAVSVAAAGAKLRPPQPFPPELKRFLRVGRLAPPALARVRAAVDGDDGFRKQVASHATDELVDEVGMLWLERPDGWAQAIEEAVQGRFADDAAIHREDRRRQRAQELATRARAEQLGLAAELEREREARTSLVAEGERLRREVDDLRHRLREAQRNEHASAQALSNMEGDLAEARSAAVPPAPPPPSSPIDAAMLRQAISGAISAVTDAARLLGSAVDELAALDVEAPQTPVEPERRPARRTAMKLPGGVLLGSIESAEFLLRAAGAQVLIDGYNVAKLGWPSLDLDDQRQQCIRAAENLAKRWNADITVVFDGASIEGAHARSRRRVRIVYSPAGVSADDVLRAEVASTNPELAIVVVTNDRAIITDVVADGANTVSSESFLALAR